MKRKSLFKLLTGVMLGFVALTSCDNQGSGSTILENSNANDSSNNSTIVEEQSISSKTVSFEVDGGSIVPIQIITKGAHAFRPIDPVKDGYIFDNWYKDEAKTTAFDFNEDLINADTTIYAKWNEKELENEIIDFSQNDKAVVSNSKIADISGNVKADLTIQYNGKDYTTCLKMETATSITLTLAKAAKVTIVTDTNGKNIKANGTKFKTDANGIVVIDLNAGVSSITKGDSMNVACIIVEYK